MGVAKHHLCRGWLGLKETEETWLIEYYYGAPDSTARQTVQYITVDKHDNATEPAGIRWLTMMMWCNKLQLSHNARDQPALQEVSRLATYKVYVALVERYTLAIATYKTMGMVPLESPKWSFYHLLAIAE